MIIKHDAHPSNGSDRNYMTWHVDWPNEKRLTQHQDLRSPGIWQSNIRISLELGCNSDLAKF